MIKNSMHFTRLGISCSIGASIYLVTMTVISHYTGPAIIVSYLIAGLAALCAGKSISEKNPKFA